MHVHFTFVSEVQVELQPRLTYETKYKNIISGHTVTASFLC